MTFALRKSHFVILAALGVLAFGIFGSRADELAAGPGDPFQDSDGDLLPDTLEWVLMSDPLQVDTDGDGVDDFLEAAQNQPPYNPAGASGQIPLDHEMRSVLAYYTHGNGELHAVFHILMRIATGKPGTIHSVSPFVDYKGTRQSIGYLVARGLVHVGYKIDPEEGLLVLLASRIAGPAELTALLPCSVGVEGKIGSKEFQTGTLLANISGTVAAITPFGNNRFALQPIDKNQDPNQPFWTQSHVCQLELIPIGSGSGSTICQVGDAGCTGVPTLRCAPNCDQMGGSIYFVPFGLGFLSGN